MRGDVGVVNGDKDGIGHGGRSVVDVINVGGDCIRDCVDAIIEHEPPFYIFFNILIFL